MLIRYLVQVFGEECAVEMQNDVKNVLIVGATSAIAIGIAKAFAARGDALHLVARSRARLDVIAADFKLRGAISVNCYEDVMPDLSGIDVVVLAYGILGDQKKAQTDIAEVENIVRVNFTSVAQLLTKIAEEFERKKQGFIAVISSVAGDRGRKSNYVYGSSKAALNIFTQGLRNRLFASKVKVLTIKPGFVKTPMTSHLKQGILFADAGKVGAFICRMIVKGKNKEMYVPRFWFFVMSVIKIIPEFVFKRLNL
jgi:short-subunit dehydrogenase